MEYIFTNSSHTNQLCGVTPREFIKEEDRFEYDKEKYREMLLEAAETVLEYLVFIEPPLKIFQRKIRSVGILLCRNDEET